MNAVELTTSPTLGAGLDDGIARWAGEGGGARPPRGPPRRTSSVSYLFDDVEPVVLRVHDPAYLGRVALELARVRGDGGGGAAAAASKRRRELFRCVSVTMTGDTYASARSLHAALCASFAVCKAVDSVVRGEHRNAFAVVRPPGHHAGERGSTAAGRDAGDGPELVGQGFCLINHVAVGARYALANHGDVVRRVAVVDWDVHHGNGTEQILAADDGPLARDALRDAVLFASIHGADPPGAASPLFPGTARTAGGGARRAVNAPLPRGTGPAEFLDHFRRVLAAVEAFGPDLVLPVSYTHLTLPTKA